MNLDFASVWEMVSDLVPENDALICGEDIVSWKEYDDRASKIASALSEASLNADAILLALSSYSFHETMSSPHIKASFSGTKSETISQTDAKSKFILSLL